MDEPDDLPPEARNTSQDDAAGQSQTLAEEALRRARQLGAQASVRAGGGPDPSGSMPDVIDHMAQMVSSGRIDMSAFRGERMDDDDDESLGPQGIEDEFPRGAE